MLIRNVWSAALSQAKSEGDRLACANVFVNKGEEQSDTHQKPKPSPRAAVPVRNLLVGQVYCYVITPSPREVSAYPSSMKMLTSLLALG